MAKLYFYYSAMNAGKTTTLLQSAYNYHERGMRTLVLTPRLDDRTGEGVVASRIGLKARATVFNGSDDLMALVQADIAARGALGCVLVDEAQFMSKSQVWQLSDVVDKLGCARIFVVSCSKAAATCWRWLTTSSRSRPSAIPAGRRRWWCASTRTVAR